MKRFPIYVFVAISTSKLLPTLMTMKSSQLLPYLVSSKRTWSIKSFCPSFNFHVPSRVLLVLTRSLALKSLKKCLSLSHEVWTGVIWTWHFTKEPPKWLNYECKLWSTAWMGLSIRGFVVHSPILYGYFSNAVLLTPYYLSCSLHPFKKNEFRIFSLEKINKQ